MKIKLTLIYILIALFSLMSADAVHASDSVAVSSAKLESELAGDEVLLKQMTIKSVLNRYDSPITGEADSFVTSAYKHNIDPYLLVSISGLESYFGSMMVDGSYNAYGWGGGWVYFDSWDDGIETISQALRENYYDQGAQNIYDVGSKYAESPTWAVRVEGFMGQFYTEEAKIRSAFEVL